METYLLTRRIVFVGVFALVVFALTPGADATDLDPLAETAGAVVGTVEAVVETVTSTEVAVDAAVAPAPAVATVTEKAVPAPAGALPEVALDAPVTPGAAAGAVSAEGAPLTTETGPAGAGRGTGSTTVRRGAGAGNVLASSAKPEPGGSAMEKVLGAGNGIGTTTMLGARIQSLPKSSEQPSRGAPLALTGGSIFAGLIIGLALIAVGTGARGATARHPVPA